MTVVDSVLLDRYARNRDPEAFAELVRRYAGLVYGTCLRTTGNPQDAEDVAQECFLELARKAKRIHASLPGWLHQVARHKSIDLVRRETRRKSREDGVTYQKNTELDPTWSELLPYIDDALAALPETLRTGILLHYFDGLSQKEVAERLGVSQATVSRDLNRSILELREHLVKTGVAISAAVLVSLLAKNATSAAPNALIVSATKIGLVGIRHSGATTGASASLAKVSLPSKIVGAVALVILTPLVFTKKAGIVTLAVMAALAAIKCIPCSANALPAVPQMVSELYLHQEQTAADAAYQIYSALPADELGKVNGGGSVSISKKLPKNTLGTFAEWFNSARWGCEQPEEHLDADAVAKSQLALEGKDGVVDLSMQSPGKGIQKILTIACPSEKAEWVRDGLPLLPSWFITPWKGGAYPPKPTESDFLTAPADIRPIHARNLGYTWNLLRQMYGVYAGLPADSLRKFHRSYALEVPFSDLPRFAQQSLANAYDEMHWRWEASGTSKSFGRPPELLKRLYGITRLRLYYVSSGPFGDVPIPSRYMGTLDNLSPYRAVFMRFDPLIPPYGQGPEQTWQNPPLSQFYHWEEIWIVACPSEFQRQYSDWRARGDDWTRKWQYFEGRQQYTKLGAPPYPSKPWGKDK